MKKLLIAVLPVITLVSCSFSINGLDIGMNERMDMTETKNENIKLEANDAEKINIDMEVGQCSVSYGETENVEINVRYECRGIKEKKILAAIENVKLTHEIKNEILYIRFDGLPRTDYVSCITDLDIYLPKSFRDFEISNDVGDIDLNDLSGSFDISTDVGDIKAEKITLTDYSKLETDVGNVDISLVETAECEFEVSVDVGNIDIDTNDMEYAENEISKDYVAEEYEVVIGGNCKAELSTNVGNISIRK